MCDYILFKNIFTYIILFFIILSFFVSYININRYYTQVLACSLLFENYEFISVLKILNSVYFSQHESP